MDDFDDEIFQNFLRKHGSELITDEDADVNDPVVKRKRNTIAWIYRAIEFTIDEYKLAQKEKEK